MSKSALGGKQELHGAGTRVAGYVDSPVEKKCSTCEYFVGKGLCQRSVMQKDREVPTDKKIGLKIVDPEDGCCNWWEVPDNDEDDK